MSDKKIVCEICGSKDTDQAICDDCCEFESDTPQAEDRIFRPNHYARYELEPWTFIMVNKLPFDVGCVIKYVMRAPYKNGIEDLNKAKRIIDMMIEMEENKKDYTPPKGCL